MVWIRVRNRLGGGTPSDFTLHFIYCVGLLRRWYSVIANHKSRRIPARSSLASHSISYSRVLGNLILRHCRTKGMHNHNPYCIGWG